MKFGTRIKLRLNEFSKDTAGSFAMTLAVSVLAITFSVGSAFDYSQLNKAQALAQHAADNMALTASIAVDNENDERYVENKKYSFESLTGSNSDFTKSITGKVSYGIIDDQDAGNSGKKNKNKTRLIARSELTGSYKPVFLSVFGVKAIPFQAISDVTYTIKKTTPASVFLILDNSGSMNFDDKLDKNRRNDYNERTSRVPGANPRMPTLLATSKSFMGKLRNIETEFSKNNKNLGGKKHTKILRTAMWPYTHEIKNSIVVKPKWGIVTDFEINKMKAKGGTNSYLPMKDAWRKMKIEDAIHKRGDGNSKPLKFVIFMTDGVNDADCEIVSTVVPAHYEWRIRWRGRYYYSKTYRRGWRKIRISKKVVQEKVCGNTSSFDAKTLKVCSDMKESGVIIYTIGYSLEPGRYHRNDGAFWANVEYDRYHYVLEKDVSDRAYTLLRGCASSPEHFKLAENSDALINAFDDIGKSIFEDVIRIKR